MQKTIIVSTGKSSFIAFCVLFITMFFSASMHAQMLGSDAYIQTSFLEIGINGAGGQEGCPTPIGIHERSHNPILGFVANPQKNLWANYDGDFFTPGSPESGWGFKVGAGGFDYNNNDDVIWAPDIRGSITSFTRTGSCYQVVWEGHNPWEGFNFKIVYDVEDGKLFYNTTVYITNVSGSTKNDIYYMRTLDPDNNVMMPMGEFTTQNECEEQPYSNPCQLACVSAQGMGYDPFWNLVLAQPWATYLGLAAVGPNYRVSVGGFSNRNPYDVWNGFGYMQTVGTPSINDEAIALAKWIPTLANGVTDTVRFVTILQASDKGAAVSSLMKLTAPGALFGAAKPCSPPDTIKACDGKTDLSVAGPLLASYSFSWAPSAGLSSVFGSTVSASVSAPTSYTCFGTPLSACAAPIEFKFIVVPIAGPTITAVPSPTSICLGSSATITAGGSITSYTWSTGAISPTIVVSPTVTTTYTVSSTNAAGCVGTKTVSVVVNPTPTITVNSGTICSGSSFTMVPGGALSYTYAGGSAVVSPTTTTTYTVRGTGAGGCLSNIVTSTVTVNPTPTITALSGTICSGSSFTMVPSGAVSYTYAGGSSVVSPTTTTTYTIRGTSAAGCLSSVITVTVTVNPTPTITVNSGTICSGSSFTMVPGGALTYTYAGGSAVVSPTTTTTYTVRGTSAAGCLSNIVTSTVTVNPTPTITVNSGTICSGSSFTMVPGGAVSYTYAGGSSVVSPTTTTTYTVRGTSAAGCLSNIVTSTVTVNPTPTITASSGTICSGSSFTMVPSGAVSYTYAGGSSVVSPTTTTTYTIRGTSAAGCLSNIITVTVTVNPTPTITVNSGTICSGSSFTMVPGGALTYTYAGGSAVVSPTTTTTYTVRGTSAAGCLSNIVTSTVTVNPTPTITVNSGTICSGSSFTMVPGGALSYTYAGGSAVISPTTTTTYTVRGTSAAGCLSNIVTSTVTVNPTPTITVNSGTICPGGSFTMTPGGAVSYTYAGGSAIVTPTATTTYTVRGTSAAGCLSNIVTSTVTVGPNISITVNSGTICSGQSFTMVPGGALTYTYAGGSAVVSPTTTTTYTVMGTNAFGCISTPVTSTVTVNATPTITVNSGTICSGQSFTMVPGGAVSYTYAGGSSIVSPTTTATYTVTGTNALGCVSAPVTSTVTVNSTPTITVNSGAICSGASFTMVPGGAVSYTYAGGSSVVSPTTTTTYTVIGTSAAGCVSTPVTSTVTVNATPTITVNSGTICSSQSFTMVPGGAVSYTYAGGSAVVSPTTTTTYTVQGSSAAGCLSNVVTSTVTVNTTPTITVNSGTICSSQSFTMISGGAVSYTYAGGSSVVSPTTTTTYTVIGSSAAGCVSTPITSTVTVNTTPTITVNSGTICSGQSFTMLPGGAASYTYAGGSSVVSPTTTTTYTVQGSSVAGCLSNVVTSTVTVNTTPTITVNSGTICSSQSFTMVPGGAVSYTYAGGSSVVSPTTTTTYTVIGSSAAGCVSTPITSTVTVNTTPTITVNSGTICSTQSFTMLPGGAVSYTYAGGSSVVSPTTTTTYTVIGSSAAGCISTPVTSTVTVNTTPTITVNSSSICPGQSFTMSPLGAASYTYAGGSSVVSPTTTTTYTVIGASLAGCVSTPVTSSVTVNITPTITVNSGSICSGQSFTMVPAGAATYTYAGGSSVVSPMTTTSYTVMGTSLQGCLSNVVTSTVTVNITPTISVNSGTICSGQSFTMNPSGAATYTYAGGSSVVSPITNTTYTVIGASLAGCPSNVVTSSVTVYTTPTITVNSGSICAGQSFTMTPSGAASYVFSGGGTAVVAPLTTTIFTVTGTSLLGCVSSPVTSTLIVNQNPVVAIDGKTVICSGKSTTLTLSGAATYSWSPSTYLDVAVGGTVISTPKSSTVYTITAVSAEGCMSLRAAPINVIQTPSISVSASRSLICEGESTTLATSGAFTFSWSPGNSLSSVSSNPTVASPTVTTTYTVEGFNMSALNSCVASNTVQVVVIPKVVPLIDPVLPICLGQSRTLKASGGTTYTWSPIAGLSKPTSSITVAQPTVTTLYTVKISKGGLCTQEATVNIVVNPLPIVDAGKDTTVNIGESVTLFGKGNVTVGFKTIDGEPLYCNYCSSVTVSPKETTCYELRGENSFGCVSVDDVCVKVTKDWNVYIPNAFTVNEDGINEYFLPQGYGIAKMSLTIFDRWGSQLFHEETVEKGWDGKYQAKICKQDVYVYVVEIRTMEGSNIKKTGHLTLISKVQ